METNLLQLDTKSQIKGLISNTLGHLSKFGMNVKVKNKLWDE